MKFSLSVEPTGELVVSNGPETLALPASFARDLCPLGDATIRLLQGSKSETFGWPVGAWFTPPGDYRWLLTREDEDVAMEVRRFPEPFSHAPDDQGTPVFNARCPLRRFALQVKHALQQLPPKPGNEAHAAATLRKLDAALRGSR